MIGMNQIKKRLLYGILIGLAVGVIGIVITIIITNKTIKSYENGTNKDFLDNYTTMVVTFNRDVRQGETITADMISMARVHVTTVPSNVASQGGAVGQIAKYNIPKNVTVVNSMLSTSIISQDVRTQQVTAVLLPAKLTVGEIIDIRLQVPSGIEYVVLPQKQVLDISGTTIWLNLSEEELLLLNSAIVDSYYTEGSKLYAVEYADPDTQIKTDDAAMEEARAYIESKITEELDALTDGEISKANEALTEANNKNNENNENNENVDTTTEVTDEGEVITVPDVKIPVLPASDLVDLISTYAIEYRYFVEAYSKMEITYQPSETIMSAMKSNKYVVEQARERLSEEARIAMLASIDAFEKSVGEEDYNSIISGINNSISTQQNLRNQVLSSENTAE